MNRQPCVQAGMGGTEPAPDRVFIGGLPYYLAEEQVRARPDPPPIRAALHAHALKTRVVCARHRSAASCCPPLAPSAPSI